MAIGPVSPRRSSSSTGLATVLAIGTALPPHESLQLEFAESYFEQIDCANNDQSNKMKSKLQLICERSAISKRHFHHQPKLTQSSTVSTLPVNQRFSMAARAVPQLMSQAAEKALAEWGEPVSKITHLVVATITGVEAPGADLRLLSLLGLRSNVKRTMLYFGGCSAGATSLRVAKDLAENNPGSRVLVVCCEMASLLLDQLTPQDLTPSELVSSAIFADGAGSVIVGSNPVRGLEKPLYEIHFSMQNLIPDSEAHDIGAEVRDSGLLVHLSKEVPKVISKNIATVLGDTMLNYTGCNSHEEMFWVVHPGGKAVIDGLLQPLGLSEEKVTSARKVLDQCGNMSSTTVLFVLDETRRRSKLLGKSTTGEGCEWGAMLAFGPGITMETLLLKSFPR